MNKVISKTQSVCPVCLRVLEADRVLGGDGYVYLEKTCPGHGAFTALIWEGDLDSYLAWDKDVQHEKGPEAAPSGKAGCPANCGLCPDHETGGCCVLLELTARCNLRCPVCFAAAGEKEGRDPTLSELAALYDMLMERGGPFNIQLSGGEPTMRDDLPEVIALGREKGFTYFQLNTNGLRLAQEADYAEKLKAVGLSCVFLQFDGLREDVYETLRGRPLLDIKKQAVSQCAAAGLGVVLVPVIAPGVNEDQVGDILRYAMAQLPAVRGVHFQPVSHFGRCALDQSPFRITIPRMLRLIEEQTGGLMKAADFAGGGAENPYCSFHASYMRLGGRFRALKQRDGGCCCTTVSESRDFVARQWGGVDELPAGDPTDMAETSALDEFLGQARENTLAVSGMVFMDARNLDLSRLRRCMITEADGKRGMVPFCAYNLTDTAGRALYRK